MAISGCQKGWSETRCNISKHNTEIPCLKLGTTKQWFHVRLHIRLLMLQIQRFYYCAHFKSWRDTTYCYRVLHMVLTWDRKVLWNSRIPRCREIDPSSLFQTADKWDFFIASVGCPHTRHVTRNLTLDLCTQAVQLFQTNSLKEASAESSPVQLYWLEKRYL